MSWPTINRLCRNCGGVTISKRSWGSGVQLRNIDNCDFCNAPLTEADNYDGYKIPDAHAREEEK